jgi:hypothetical protein
MKEGFGPFYGIFNVLYPAQLEGNHADLKQGPI